MMNELALVQQYCMMEYGVKGYKIQGLHLFMYSVLCTLILRITEVGALTPQSLSPAQ